LRLRPKAHRPLLLTGPHRAPAGITLGTLQPERSKNAQEHLRSQLSVDQWRAERQDDNGPGEQPGPSLKDPLHVTSPLLQGRAMFRRRRLPVVKGGFCVSTVSIVCGRAPGSMAVVAGCIYWTGRRLARPRVVMVIADDADGADGIFWPRMDPDHSGSSSAFTTEGNLNSPYSKERLRTTQAAPRPRGGSWANLWPR
jgi:hypothetical protein